MKALMTSEEVERVGSHGHRVTLRNVCDRVVRMVFTCIRHPLTTSTLVI